MTQERTRGRWLVTLVATALLASAGAAAIVGPATAQSTGELDVTQTYQPVPEESGNLTVVFTVENPEVADRIEVDDEYDLSNVRTDDFTYVEEGYDGYWVAEDGVDRPTLTATWEVDEDDEDFGEYAIWAPASYDETDVEATDADGNPVDVNATMAADPGRRTFSGHLFVGEYQRATARAPGVTIEVIVHAGEPMAEDPQAIANATAAAATEMEAGSVDEDVTVFASDARVAAYEEVNGGDVAGFAPFDGDHHFTRSDKDAHGVENTWIHEYVHTTEAVDEDTTMEWFSEAYGEYGGSFYPTATGYAGFGAFERTLGDGIQEPSNLSDPGTWEPSQVSVDRANNDYDQGALVLGAIDRDVRQATPGEKTLQDVVRRMHAHEGEVTRSDFLTMINETVTGNPGHSAVGSRAAVWTVSDDEADLPETWTYDQHVETFDDVPLLQSSGVSARVRGDGGTRDTRFEDDLVLTTDERFVLEESVTNDGSLVVEQGASLLVDDTGDGAPDRRVDLDTATVGTDETRTLAVSHSFAEPGSYTVSVGDAEYDVTVHDPRDRVVFYGGDHDARKNATTLTPNRSTLGVQAPDDAVGVSVETSDGTEVASRDLRGVETNHVTLQWADLTAGTDYVVRFDTTKDPSPQYVTTLEPVDGTYVRDVDGDGLHRDVNGDGKVGHSDVVEFFDSQHLSSVRDYPEAYDYSGDGDVTHGDVNALFDYVGSREL